MYIGNRFPFRIDSSLVGYIFFSFGYFAKNFLSRIQKINIISLIGIILISAVVLCLITLYDFDPSQSGGMSINALRFGKTPCLFIVSGVAGTLFVFSISQLLSFFKCRWILLISNGTIIVLGFQQLLITLFRGHIVSENPLFAMLFSLFILLLCFIIICLSNRYFPILGGNRSKS